MVRPGAGSNPTWTDTARLTLVVAALGISHIINTVLCACEVSAVPFEMTME